MKLFKAKVYSVFCAEEEISNCPVIIKDDKDTVRLLTEQTFFIWEESVKDVIKTIEGFCPFNKKTFVTELTDHESVYENKEQIMQILNQLKKDK